MYESEYIFGCVLLPDIKSWETCLGIIIIIIVIIS
jgi:hypothetical protein